jgi:hypothetical protein
MLQQDSDSAGPARDIALHASLLLRFLRDPGPDVRRTVAKLDAIGFAPPQEPDNVSIHEDYVLEVQCKGPVCPFGSKQCGQFVYIALFETATHREHNLTISESLDFAHRSSRRTGCAIGSPSQKC